ncbi:MAG: TIM barrel protein [Acidobacteria bacterium]|nr:TIM barrel protein [Acidobacteriota bacterium]
MAAGKSGLLLAVLFAAVAAPLSSGAREILYVTNSGGDDVTLVDAATRQTIGSIRTGPTPHGLEAAPDGSRVYVSGETDNDIVAIDTATSSILWKALLGGRPNHIAVSGDGRFIYVPIRSADYADVVDAEARRRIKSIPVGRGPHNAYRSPDGKWIYVTSMGENKISIIDVASQSVIGAIPLGGEPRPAAITSDNRRLYVALTGLRGFVVADVVGRKVIDKVELPPADVADVSTYGYTPTHGLAMRPDNRQFWITNVFGNAVEGLSVPDHRLLATIPVGLAPNWMTFGPEGRFLYVSNAGSNDISVVDTELMREAARVKVGLAPKRLLVVRVPTGLGGPQEPGWKAAARRPSASDYYLKGGGILSAESYSFRDLFKKGELRVESAPAFWRRLGVRGLSMKAAYFKSRDDNSLERFKQALREDQRVFTAMILDGNLVSDDEAANRKQIEEDKRLLSAAHYLGAPVVRVNVGSTGRGDDADQREGVERAIRAFREMLPLAKELGIRLAIENHGGPSKTADGIIRIIRGTDKAWVGACLDFGNWDDRTTMYAEIEKLAPYVFHTHVKVVAFDRYGNESTIDYPKALGILARTGYHGALSIEFEGEGDPVTGVTKMRDLLVKLWMGAPKTVPRSSNVTQLH